MLATVTTTINGVSVQVDVDVDVGQGETRTIVIGVSERHASEILRRVEQIVVSRGHRLPTGRSVIAVTPAVETEIISDTLVNAIADAVLRATDQIARPGIGGQ